MYTLNCSPKTWGQKSFLIFEMLPFGIWLFHCLKCYWLTLIPYHCYGSTICNDIPFWLLHRPDEQIVLVLPIPRHKPDTCHGVQNCDGLVNCDIVRDICDITTHGKLTATSVKRFCGFILWDRILMMAGKFIWLMYEILEGLTMVLTPIWLLQNCGRDNQQINEQHIEWG